MKPTFIEPLIIDPTLEKHKIATRARQRFYNIKVILRLGFVLTAATIAGTAMANSTSSPQIKLSTATEAQNWIVVNDTVMGGRSQASIKLGADHMRFDGDLSMLNNGGFASIRRVDEPINWQASTPMQIVVKGDGRTYQFRLRTDRYIDGVAYVAPFQTVKGEWQTIRFTTNDFTPQFRGRLVPRAPALTFADVTQLGFMLADGAPGEFALDIKEISQGSEGSQHSL